ncbi:MAG: hypothetical protein AAF711_20320 [Planctomycetota bacterium]
MKYDIQKLRDQVLAVTLGAALIAIPALAAHAEDSTQTVRATITIPKPRSANLLQLRGIGGRGTALLQVGGACHSMPVRLVAGDFEGRQANLRDQDPIVLELRDPELVQALSRGVDIVSDEATVSADLTDHEASILLLSGLAEGTGFVINPGRTLVSDIFGARMSAVSCDVFNRSPTATPAG